MFHKVLIANRGEIAVRIIRTCRDLGIISAAVYSEADRASLHVRLADEAYYLGPAPSAESYLNIGKMIAAARSARADAIHPGYGFQSENPDFAAACADAGIAFVGPSAQSMKLTAYKTSARAFIRSMDIPLVPGTDQPPASIEAAANEAHRLEYPVLVKAAARRGGRGMRLVKNDSQLRVVYPAAASLAGNLFGDASLYLEKYLPRPHRIEIQVLADRHGNVISLGERECPLQRRNRKLLEECPSPFFDEALRCKLGELAVRIVRAARYENAGTVEFLVDNDRNFYFLEMNARLQVEHPITEVVTGVDIVAEQLRIACGEPLSLRQDQVQQRGWALLCRICAEDPEHGLAPSPGVIRGLEEPQGPGVRLDSGVYQGWEVTTDYDPLLAKLIVSGSDRGQAVARLIRALREYRIAGIRTNVPIFAEILSSPEFLAGKTHAGLLDEVRKGTSKGAATSSSLFNSHALAAALAYAEATEPSYQQPEQETENPWRLSGRPGFSNIPRR